MQQHTCKEQHEPFVAFCEHMVSMIRVVLPVPHTHHFVTPSPEWAVLCWPCRRKLLLLIRSANDFDPAFHPRLVRLPASLLCRWTVTSSAGHVLHSNTNRWCLLQLVWADALPGDPWHRKQSIQSIACVAWVPACHHTMPCTCRARVEKMFVSGETYVVSLDVATRSGWPHVRLQWGV